MSKQEKALRRLSSKPTDFTWPELASVMNALGIEMTSASGSGRKFRNPVTGKQFTIHQPHPSNILKRYQVNEAVEFLEAGGFRQVSTTVSYRGYDGSIIHDAQDSLYHGKILGIRDTVIYHGDTPEEAETIFHEVVDSYLSDFEAEGNQPPKPFASLPTNLPHELQLKAALFAHEHHLDLESVFQSALSDFLDRAA
jgi:predicted HicB family RNase H-like nuclease